MADITSAVKSPTLAGQNLSFVPVSAEDTFVARPNSSYILLYFNDVTPSTGPLEVVDQVTVIPDGSDAVAGFANVVVDANGLGAGVTQFSIIPNSNRFRDADGLIHLVHGGTIDDLNVAVLGPLPAVGG